VRTQADRIACFRSAKGAAQMAVLERRVQRPCVIVEHQQQMITGKDDTRGGAALRSVEQGGVKIIAAASDLEMHWDLLAMNRGVTCPGTGNRILGDGRGNEQEKTSEELHEGLDSI
jgi:hypothetical protein